MEGIYDGGACDDCFLCALLEPESYDGDCPRCHNRMRYQPAVHMDAPTLEHNVVAATARLSKAGADERHNALTELLTLLHRFAPAGPELLVSKTDTTLDSLRAAWAELS